jgi:hypothetical protein
MDRKRIGDILMAHFAELDENNIVINVIVVHNNEIIDDDGNESEAKGIDFCVAHFGGRWIQTSYNATIRKNYAGIGHTYDLNRDAFIATKPENAIGFDEETCQWIMPETE